jgi:C-terminal processing protease CtpA/Prc
VTPVVVYLPTQCNFDMDKKSMEGIGVEPDIEVAYDRKKFTSTGYDSQLDRALEYIRSKN